MLTGPDVSGSRPVLVTFEQFKDREDVFRKESKLKGTNIHIRSAYQTKIVLKVPNSVSNFCEHKHESAVQAQHLHQIDLFLAFC
jgi:hypothetical protein